MSNKDLMSRKPKNPIIEGANSNSSKGKTKVAVTIIASVLALGAGIGVGYGIYEAGAFGPVVTDEQADNVEIIDTSNDTALLRKKTDGTIEDVADQFVQKPEGYNTATNLFGKDTSETNGVGNLNNAAEEGYYYSKPTDTPEVKDIYQVTKTATTGDGVRLTTEKVNANYIIKPTGADLAFDGDNSKYLWVKGDDSNGKGQLKNAATEGYLYVKPTTSTNGDLYEVKDADADTGSRLKNVNSNYIIKPTNQNNANTFDTKTVKAWAKGDDSNGKGQLVEAWKKGFYYSIPTDTPAVKDIYEVTRTRPVLGGARLTTEKVNAKYIIKPGGFGEVNNVPDSNLRLWVRSTSTNGKGNIKDASNTYLYTLPEGTPSEGDLYSVFDYDTNSAGLNKDADTGSRLSKANVNGDYIVKPEDDTSTNDVNEGFDGDVNADKLWQKDTSSETTKGTLKDVTNDYIKKADVRENYIKKADVRENIRNYVQFPHPADIPSRIVNGNDNGKTGSGTTANQKTVFAFNSTSETGDTVKAIITTNSYIYDMPDKKGGTNIVNYEDLGGRTAGTSKKYYFVGNTGEYFVAFVIKVTIDAADKLVSTIDGNVKYLYLKGNSQSISTFSYNDINDTNADGRYSPLAAGRAVAGVILEVPAEQIDLYLPMRFLVIN